MRALILGAAGQVGRALAAAAPAGAETVALDREACDVTDQRQVRAALARARPDVVLNAAAFTAVDRAEEEAEAAHALNAAAPAIVAAAAREAGARTVHLSTDFVFAGTGGAPLAPGDPAEPLGVYGRTKLAGERAALAADADALVVRTAWVYAARGRNFVNTMLGLMREREEIRVVDDQLGTPTWAPSLAQALWGLAERGARGVHHYTDAGVASWYDFAVAIAEEARAAGLLKRSARIVPVAGADFPTPARRPVCAVLDKRATWALLGGPPPHWRVNLRANLAEVADG